MNHDIMHILEYLSSLHGFDFSENRSPSLGCIIDKRMADNEIEGTKEYLRYLKRNSEELVTLMDCLTINVSRFFRNPLTFEHIAQRTLPDMVSEKRKTKDRSIRVWSAGCASGEEPYSVAILLNEIMKKEKYKMDIDIFATDISRTILRKAQRGIYCFDQIKDIKHGILSRYFIQRDDAFHLIPNIKEMVSFSFYDMIDPRTYVPPESVFGNFDLVLCRNLLIYFRVERQKVIFDKLFRSLSHRGWLVLGEAERLPAKFENQFAEENGYCRIYRKRR